MIKKYFIRNVVLLGFLLFISSCLKEELEREILLQTGNVFDLGITKTKLKGQIIDSGEGIDQFGHCWSKHSNPSFNDNFSIVDEQSDGGFVSEISGLSDETTYYYVSYAKKGSSIVYGEVKTFTTAGYDFADIGLYVKEIYDNSIIVSLSISDFGGADSLRAYGVCWSKSLDPTIDDFVIDLGTTTEFNRKEVLISNLDEHTDYYIKAFAVNKKGISYSNNISIQTTLNIIIPDGLLAYYPFRGDVDDYSGNENHAINYGATLTSDRFENANSAYSFDGKNSYMRLNKTLDASQGLTFSFWILSRGSLNDEYNGVVIGKYDMSGRRSFVIGSFGFSNDNTANKIKASYYSSSYTSDYADKLHSDWTPSILPGEYNSELFSFYSPTELTIYEWNFAVINMTNEEIQIWINGEITVSKIREYNFYANSDYEPIYLGNLLNAGFGDNNHLNGILDDLRIYNRALTEDEILSLYHEGGWNL